MAHFPVLNQEQMRNWGRGLKRLPFFFVELVWKPIEVNEGARVWASQGERASPMLDKSWGISLMATK